MIFVSFQLVNVQDGSQLKEENTQKLVVKQLLWIEVDPLHHLSKMLEWVNQTAEAAGYVAVKYADLKNNILTNYKFNYDQILGDKINREIQVYTFSMRMRKYIPFFRDLVGQLILEHD